MKREKQQKTSPSSAPLEESGTLPGKPEESAECVAEAGQDSMPYPPMYQVVMLNDDYTPMDFVTELMERVFNMPPLEARSKMFQVHQDGHSVCGTYTHDVAETKVVQVMDTAVQYHYPLKCIMRKETRYAVKKP